MGENRGRDKRMRAWVLRDIGDIRLEDTDTVVPQAGEVLIQVKAAGICGSDIPRIYETGAHRMPLIPGHEFSGIVESVGKDADGYWMGKRVGVYPLIPCGQCRQCAVGHPEMCRDYDYIGSRRDGAFAEYVPVPVSNLIELPERASFEDGAMLEPMAVAMNAMRTGVWEMEPAATKEASIAVCGLGTIGLFVVMLLKEAGFQNIYAIGNKDFQKQMILSLGIPENHYCDSRKEDVVEWLKYSTGGVFAYYDCVGSNECVSNGMDVVAPGGRLILVGNPRSDMVFPRDTYWKLLRNQVTVRGIWNSTFSQTELEDLKADDWHYALKKITEGTIHPGKLVTHRFGLSELEKGFHIMRDKTEDYGKILMVNE